MKKLQLPIPILLLAACTQNASAQVSGCDFLDEHKLTELPMRDWVHFFGSRDAGQAFFIDQPVFSKALTLAQQKQLHLDEVYPEKDLSLLKIEISYALDLAGDLTSVLYRSRYDSKPEVLCTLIIYDASYSLIDKRDIGIFDHGSGFTKIIFKNKLNF